MSATPARRRVIISNIQPTVDFGKYPAKIVVNQPVKISADIFTDGIDRIAATLLYRHNSVKTWKEITLQPANNDRWEIELVPEKTGKFYFQVTAWIDQFATWQSNIQKKFQAEQDILVDLKGGVGLAEDAWQRATGKDQKVLSNWMQALSNVTDGQAGFELSKDSAIETLLCKYRDKNRATTYPHIFELFAEPEKSVYSTWYELFPRSTSEEPGKHGTFNDVIKLVPGIAKMGFDVLYLPPIHPIGFNHRKGKNNSLTASENDPGSPWAIGSEKGGHKEIHPELGTLKDFKKLIVTATKHGLSIAMDIAFQCSPDHPYVKKHPEWFKWRADGTVQFAENPPKKYEDILPFDFESSEFESLWMELKSVLSYWAECGIRIFRVDNPHTKSMLFWEWVIREMKAEYPDLIFLAEAFTRPRIMEHLAKIGFTQSYTYFAWRNTKRELEEYLNELTQTNLKYYFRPNFWPNTPDILTDELVHGGENAHIIRLLLAATMCSSYGIYGPVYELCVNEPTPGKEEYYNNEKYELKNWDWTGYTRLREIITRTNRIRKENKALQRTDNIIFAETDNDQVICYLKADETSGNIMIMVVNLDAHNTQTAHIKLPLYKVGIPYTEPFIVEDLFSGDRYDWGEYVWVSLDPYEFPAHILKVNRK